MFGFSTGHEALTARNSTAPCLCVHVCSFWLLFFAARADLASHLSAFLGLRRWKIIGGFAVIAVSSCVGHSLVQVLDGMRIIKGSGALTLLARLV